MGNQLIVSNSFWDICDILSNCRQKRMHLFCEVWILFFSFLERLGYHAEQEYAKLRGLRGNVGYVGAWAAWVRGSVSCMGQMYFYVDQNFLGGSIFLRGLTFFVWVKIFLRGSIFFVVGLKNIDWCFHNNNLVIYYIRIEDMLNQHPISYNSSFTWFWL